MISTLVGVKLEQNEGDEKWKGTLAAPNSSIYGIPFDARRVMKVDPVNKSITHIGPDLGDELKWCDGAITDSCVIYCVPIDDRGILKIDTNTDTVTELDADLLPEQGADEDMWESCAAALDGCIYCIPCHACLVMKIYPNNNDAMSSVGDDLGYEGGMYRGTIVGIDGCVYGLPNWSKQIVKYNPAINCITSFVGEEADKEFQVRGNGALVREGSCIYAITYNGRILKFEATNSVHCFVENSISSGAIIVKVGVVLFWGLMDASTGLLTMLGIF